MKKWYLSKTLWVNLLAVVAIILQGVTGNEVLPTEDQALLLGLINLILRIVTKQPIKW